MTIRIRAAALALVAHAPAVLVVAWVAPCGVAADSASATPSTARLEADHGLVFGVLAALGAPDAALPRAVTDALPALEFASRADATAIRAALRGDESQTGFEFARLRDPVNRDIARALVADAVTALAIRRAAIERRIAGIAPSTHRATLLRVRFVVGMPPAIETVPLVESDGRGLLVDLGNLARGIVAPDPVTRRDLLGEELERRIAPQLFIAAYLQLEAERGDSLPTSDFERARRALLVEGIADHLGRRADERFDDQGRRRPEVDYAARAALSRFERDLPQLLDPRVAESQRRDLAFAFANGPRAEQWGVVVGSGMADAIERFAPHGRLREVVTAGPREFARAYAEVCSGHAAVPRLGTATVALLARP